MATSVKIPSSIKAPVTIQYQLKMSSSEDMAATTLATGIQKLPPELRIMIWKEAVDVEGLIVSYYIGPEDWVNPTPREKHYDVQVRIRRHKRVNGVLGASRESRKYAKPVFKKRTRSMRIPHPLQNSIVPTSIGDDYIFFIPGFHSWMLRWLPGCEEYRCPVTWDIEPGGADFVVHLLVPLQEVVDLLKQLHASLGDDHKEEVAEWYWSAFPDIRYGKDRYSILVGADCGNLESRDWIGGMGIPLIKKVEDKDRERFGPEQRGMSYVEEFFLLSEERNYRVIKDWGFVTWNKDHEAHGGEIM